MKYTFLKQLPFVLAGVLYLVQWFLDQQNGIYFTFAGYFELLFIIGIPVWVIGWAIWVIWKFGYLYDLPSDSSNKSERK